MGSGEGTIHSPPSPRGQSPSGTRSPCSGPAALPGGALTWMTGSASPRPPHLSPLPCQKPQPDALKQPGQLSPCRGPSRHQPPPAAHVRTSRGCGDRLRVRTRVRHAERLALGCTTWRESRDRLKTADPGCSAVRPCRSARAGRTAARRPARPAPGPADVAMLLGLQASPVGAQHPPARLPACPPAPGRLRPRLPCCLQAPGPPALRQFRLKDPPKRQLAHRWAPRTFQELLDLRAQTRMGQRCRGSPSAGCEAKRAEPRACGEGGWGRAGSTSRRLPGTAWACGL